MFEMTATVLGTPVRIYARNVGSEQLIHGAYESDGEWYLASWLQDGHHHPKHPRNIDLLESIPELTDQFPSLA